MLSVNTTTTKKKITYKFTFVPFLTWTELLYIIILRIDTLLLYELIHYYYTNEYIIFIRFECLYNISNHFHTLAVLFKWN